ncbi:aldo/keto reductase [Leifsonia sp. Root112D2]|uniref:aldo/keto reductase n=1 Tax=Leifsonia sp. Root112D2 TaxID=1736426 RepID=UPI0006FCB427|nr:aldo/keto reductase [Leifsonia sp. Root112D2]KQV06453.1 hypothetical protein ASC63_03145 [Leifsonia sp. Root112D2]
MKTRHVGDTPVSAIGLGGVHWSITDHLDVDQSIRTIHAALDAGIRLIDTARAYTTLVDESHNEDVVARALAGHPLRDEVLVATKGGHFRAGPSDFPVDGRPRTLRAHCEASLRHLRVERIGLYQLHHPDPSTPIEESMQTLVELQQEGKIRMIGVSNVNAQQLRAAQSVGAIVSVQNEFSPHKTDDSPMVAECDRTGVTYLAYSPLGGSSRSGSLGELSPALAAAADNRKVSVQRIALAWMLALSPTIIPIVGTRRAESAVDSAAATELDLGRAEFAAIDAELSSRR